jgi:vancomycin resistance protein YoaR
MVSQDKKRTVIAVASTVFLGTGALALGVATASAAGKASRIEGKIKPGVSVAGIDLGGMEPEVARDKVRAWARETVTGTPITLVAPESGRKWNVPLAEAGGRFLVDEAVEKAAGVGKDDAWYERLWMADRDRGVRITPEFRLNEKALDKQLAAIGAKIHVEPQSATARLGEGGTLVLDKPEVKGVKLDLEATRQAVLAQGVDSLRDGGQAQLVVAEERPKVTAEDLGKVGTLLGSFHTDYGASSDARRHNIEKAAGKINGTLLAPGEVFSYNTIVGPREPRLGWRNAPTYQDGQVVPGPGGGICQVSTTLYNAALRANLKIVERQGHSMPVHYVPAGCDATVNYGSIDFRFENSTPGPIYVAARTKGGELTFNLYGVPEAKGGEVEVVSGGRRYGSSGGFSVATYRVVKNADGTTRRESLGVSSYRPAPAHH